MAIIVGTDFSEASARAAELGVELARTFEDGVVIAHVFEPPVEDPLSLSTDIRVYEKRMQEDAGSRLEKEAGALRSQGVEVTQRFQVGAPHEALVALGRELPARMLVLGTHGRGAVGRALFGSVAQRVLLADEADCPEAADLPFLERDVRNVVGDIPGEGAVEVRLEPVWGERSRRLAEVAEARGADLLVVGTHQRRGPGHRWTPSTAEVVARVGQTPVLAVPAPASAAAERSVAAIRSVLVATDFSEAGNHAIPFAYGLVNAPGGVVHLCHAVGNGSPAQAEIPVRLRALVPIDATQRGIATRLEVISGPVLPRLAELAHRLDVDAVCVGSRGRERGSVAKALMQQAGKPVLVVPAPLD
jgi:nucleotide-binding universal stress UspA family protein